MKMTRNHKTGFTLIEILAVLFIIGIIFSITLPTFGPIMRTLKLTTSAENLANTLESARQYAITSGQDCYVVFPTTGEMAYKSYVLYNKDAEEILSKLEILPNSIKVSEKSTFFTDNLSISLQEDGNTKQVSGAYIKFKPNGSAYAPDSASGSIYLTDPTDTYRRIIYYSKPARCKIED